MFEAKVINPNSLLDVLEGQLEDSKAQLTNTKSRVALWRAALYMMDHPDVYWEDVSDVIDVAMAQFANANDDVLRQDFQAYFGTHSVIAAQPKPEPIQFEAQPTQFQLAMQSIESRAKALAADAKGTFQGPLAPIAYELRAMITAAVTNNPEALEYHEGQLKKFVATYRKQVSNIYQSFMATVHKLQREVREAQQMEALEREMAHAEQAGECNEYI